MTRTLRAVIAAALLGGAAIIAMASQFGGTHLADVQPPLLKWSELIPPAVRPAQAKDVPVGVVSHEQGMQMVAAAVSSAPVREDLNGREVRIAGYLVPIGLNGSKVSEFMVAPYLGACIHVPPPPANQIVLTHFKAGLEVSSRLLSEAIVITGTLRTTAVEADLGELGSAAVGYEMDASQVHYLEE